jgi:hypothetical protein
MMGSTRYGSSLAVKMKKYLGVEDVKKELRRHVNEAGSGANWAMENGFSKAFVSYVLNGQRKPSKRVLEILGFREVTVYEEV